ncbi:uncharacterized protein LOC124490222 [Dermatophagoides farinae]|uniref:Serine-type endopeptidase n=1 Tax=Dermatophagoides farinae TaxID=6954 RepID=A0A922L6P2_DERFA|nr:uncharacterized protein LOC124490222 [Dermatophagoides farinae]KAH7639132.1 hypothetical protein HUG17_3165 [Dermatophagoides farinae]KAH9522356.1 serine-type endopeptidase [Dermatophagoides farinae]
MKLFICLALFPLLMVAAIDVEPQQQLEEELINIFESDEQQQNEEAEKNEIDTDRRPVFRCPRRFGYYPARRCYQFIQCSNYRPYTMNCARGTQWDQRQLTCVHQTDCRRPRNLDEKDTDDENNERRPPKQFRCPRRSGYYRARNCYQFIQCSNGRPYVMDCAPGTQWNQRKQTCVHATNCKRPQSNDEVDEIERRPAQFKCPKPSGYYRYRDCNRFIQCSNGRPYVMDCAPGTQWNQRMQTCVMLRDCRPRMAEESDVSDEQQEE